ncbi:MAG: hypothetical protein V5804_14000 [Mucilaginibacter sp.]|uniref:hypothetical protein n=1 Tax=Mucilaginibacter sp. TaxID=1882438 RepID=UPI0034E5888E
MKKLLFLLWLLPAVCLAQTDSTKINPHYIYGRIFIEPVTFSSKITVKWDFGRISSNIYLSENEFRKLTGELSRLNNEIDVLNYLSLQGWEVVTRYQFRDENPSYFLRKKVQ